jgi:asparagine synthase (glutamine-hydrolysing)
MCGIIGSINRDFNIDDANQLLGHRGPDERNTLKLDNVILHHLRLTILDAEGGKQPMSFNERYHIIYNGEIYNHLDVRDKLDLQCNSRSDTETFLKAYIKLGPDCLHYLDGMFAVAIYDNYEKELFLARDRAGKKPLYYFKNSNQLLFASELNAIKGLVNLKVNSRNLSDYLYGGLIKELTAYDDVHELSAGTFVKINTKDLNIEKIRWWDINDFYNRPSNDSYDEAKQNVNNNLRTAIKRRLDSSDLEVGTFLSGGIDSGLVTAISAEYKESLKAFTISFDGVFDESELAKLVAQKYSLQHEIIPISFDDLSQDFENIVLNYGDPFNDSSAIPSYYVSKEAKKYLTVILNGDGADEIFGGYRRYVPYGFYDFYNKGSIATTFGKLLKPVLPFPHNKKNKYNYLYRLVDILTKKNDQIFWSSTSDTFSGFFDKFHQKPSSSITGIFDLMASAKNLSGLQKQMNLDFEIILGGPLLKKIDIATMAHSLEGRSPFLSKEMLEYAPRINDDYKVDGIRTKKILRDLSLDYLPDELINQPKRGFEIPLKNWVDNDLKGFIDKYLFKKDRFVDQFIDKDFTDQLVNDKVKISKEKRAKMLYKLLVTELWSSKN